MVQLKGLTPSGHLPVGLLSGGKQGIESGKNAIYLIWMKPWSGASKENLHFDTETNK